jgi:hypothetical protein
MFRLTPGDPMRAAPSNSAGAVELSFRLNVAELYVRVGLGVSLKEPPQTRDKLIRVCRVSRQEGEEVPGDLPQDPDNLPWWQVRSRLGELGRQRYSQLFGLGDERGSHAFAQGA